MLSSSKSYKKNKSEERWPNENVKCRMNEKSVLSGMSVAKATKSFKTNWHLLVR